MTTPRMMIRALTLMCCVSGFTAGALLCEGQLVPLYLGMAGVALSGLLKVLGAINGVYPPPREGDSRLPRRPDGSGTETPPRGDRSPDRPEDGQSRA